MATLRALVVDDEPLARARLLRLLGQLGGVDVVGDCSGGVEAIDAVQAQRPDVVFLDVQMPDLDGFDVLECLPATARPHVVFVTAHSEHAVRAFEARAADYLLKPIAAERLRQALDRVRPLPTAAGGAEPGGRVHALRLAVPHGPRIQLVPVEEIDHISAHANYVELHLGQRTLLLRETMTRLEARLDPQRFLRIHRSRIVRVDGIVDVEPYASGQYVLRLKCGVRVATGRSYWSRVRALLDGGTPAVG